MDRLDITRDDPTSASQPPPGVIDIRADGELTGHDWRQLWVGQYQLRLYFAVRRAVGLRRALDD